MEKKSEYTYNYSADKAEAFDCKKTNKFVKKAIALGLGISITTSSMFLSGCSNEKNVENIPGPAFQTAEFENNQNVFVSVTQIGETKFIERYGDLYSNPEDVYGALLDYEKVNKGESAFINPDYIDFYRASTELGEKNGDISDLGFENAKMTLADMDLEKSMDFFNSYTKKQIDLCANYLSFNPSAREVIKDQFLTYCGQAIFENDKFAGYNPESEKLFGVIESYISEYGPNSYFEMQPATEDAYTIEGSSFSHFSFMNDGKDIFETGVIPSIKVSQFENDAIDSLYISPAGEKLLGFVVRQERNTQSGNEQITDDIIIGTNSSL